MALIRARSAAAAAFGIAVVAGGSLALAAEGDPRPALGRTGASASSLGVGRGGAAPWRALRPASLARTEVAAARIGGSIYVVGGFVPPGTTIGAVERYDIAVNRWSRVRSLPVPVNHPAAVAAGGKLYVLGGYTAAGGLAGETAVVQRYDPRRGRWARIAPMPTARAALAAGVLGGRIYAAGGAARGRMLATVEAYDLRTGRWGAAPPLAVAREHVGGTVAGGAFYVVGGRSPNLGTVERYRPGARRWERLPGLRTKRSGIAAATAGRCVVVFGGEEAAGTIAPVERFDPRTRRWTALAPMRTPRHGLGGAALGRRVYSLSGGPQPGFAFSGATEALDIRGC